MIGEIVKYILDCGFFMQFTYDDTIGPRYNFKVWKYYGDDICQCAFAFGCFEVSQVSNEAILFMQTDRYLKQVDDNIAQRRLIDSALK